MNKTTENKEIEWDWNWSTGTLRRTATESGMAPGGHYHSRKTVTLLTLWGWLDLL